MNGKLRNMASIYIKCGNEMLLLDRIGSKVVDRSWCGIGGHFEKKELNNAKSAVLREMNEEIGLKENDLENLQLRYISIRIVGDEIRINYYFFADLKKNAVVNKNCNEGILEWVSLEKINERKMPVTAQFVIKHYTKIGINTENIYSVSVDSNANATITALS